MQARGVSGFAIQNVPKELHCVLPQCFSKSFAWWLDGLFLTLRGCTWNIVSLQGVIINSKDLNEHLLNLPSLTSYFLFLSTLSHLLWNLTNAFMWLIHQIGELEPFRLWVEILKGLGKMNRHLYFQAVVLQVSHEKIYVFCPIVILLPYAWIFSKRDSSHLHLDSHFSREQLSLYFMTVKEQVKTTLVSRPLS